jgi:hypothetical protein
MLYVGPGDQQRQVDQTERKRDFHDRPARLGGECTGEQPRAERNDQYQKYPGAAQQRLPRPGTPCRVDEGSCKQKQLEPPLLVVPFDPDGHPQQWRGEQVSRQCGQQNRTHVKKWAAQAAHHE